MTTKKTKYKIELTELRKIISMLEEASENREISKNGSV